MGDLRISYSNLLDHKGDFGQCIEIVNQHIDDFPKSFFNNSKAIGLTLNRNKLSKLPSQLERFKKLERLDLSNNDFDTFPEVIGDLDNLRYLNLSKNKLTSLPRDIIYLRKLEEIVLDENLFEEFPEVLFQSSLEDVAMRKNKLKRLPAGIKGMSNLRSLVVSGNQLTTIPIEIAEMPQLAELFASSNNIKGLPENFCMKAKSLKKLVLQDNPLVYPSPVAAAKGIAAMRDYEKKHPRPDIPEDVEEQKEEAANSLSAEQEEMEPEVNRDTEDNVQSNGVMEEESEATFATEAEVPEEQNDREQVVEDELPESDRIEFEGSSDAPVEEAYSEVTHTEEIVPGQAVSEEPEFDTMPEPKHTVQGSGEDEVLINKEETQDSPAAEDDNTGEEEPQESTKESIGSTEETQSNNSEEAPGSTNEPVETLTPAVDVAAMSNDQESANNSEEKGDQEETAEVGSDAEEATQQSTDDLAPVNSSITADIANVKETQPVDRQPSEEDNSPPAEVRDGDTGEIPVSNSVVQEAPATGDSQPPITSQQEDNETPQFNERLI